MRALTFLSKPRLVEVGFVEKNSQTNSSGQNRFSVHALKHYSKHYIVGSVNVAIEILFIADS